MISDVAVAVAVYFDPVDRLNIIGPLKPSGFNQCIVCTNSSLHI